MNTKLKKDNNNYYQNDDKHSIMSIENFNDSVYRYLLDEQVFTSMILAKNRYKEIIELGCGFVRSVGLATSHKMDYTGIDIQESLEEKNKYFLNENNLSNAKYITGCLSNIDKYVRYGEKSICFIPFNLLGNIGYVENFIDKCSSLKLNLVVSCFSNDDYTDSIRFKYYNSCNISNLRLVKSDKGNTFTNGDNFESIAYCPEYLSKLFKKYRYRIKDHQQNYVYNIFHLTYDGAKSA